MRHAGLVAVPLVAVACTAPAGALDGIHLIGVDGWTFEVAEGSPCTYVLPFPNDQPAPVALPDVWVNGCGPCLEAAWTGPAEWRQPGGRVVVPAGGIARLRLDYLGHVIGESRSIDVHFTSPSGRARVCQVRLVGRRPFAAAVAQLTQSRTVAGTAAPIVLRTSDPNDSHPDLSGAMCVVVFGRREETSCLGPIVLWPNQAWPTVLEGRVSPQSVARDTARREVGDISVIGLPAFEVALERRGPRDVEAVVKSNLGHAAELAFDAFVAGRSVDHVRALVPAHGIVAVPVTDELLGNRNAWLGAACESPRFSRRIGAIAWR